MQWRQFKSCFSQSVVYGDGDLPIEVREEISRSVALSLLLSLLYVLQSQTDDESLSVSQCLSSTVSIHLMITEKAQNTSQKNRSNDKTKIAQNMLTGSL